MVQRREGFDAGRSQLVNQPAVKIESLLIDLSRAVREDARPRNREPVRIRAQVLHDLHVLFVAVIVIDRHVAGVAVLHLAWRVRERVPDRQTLAVLVPRAFDLIRRRRDAPEESFRKFAIRRGLACGELHRLRLSAFRLSSRATRGHRAGRGARCSLRKIAPGYLSGLGSLFYIPHRHPCGAAPVPPSAAPLAACSRYSWPAVRDNPKWVSSE